MPDSRSVDGLYEGFLEADSGCTDVVDALVKSIQSDTGFLPQKYLYASLTGARLWQELCTGVPVNTHIAEVYKRFPLGWACDLTTAFKAQATRVLKKDGEASKQMGLIALGAGTGTREAKISQWLVNEFNLELVEAHLVDVSSELLGESLKEFHRCGDRVAPKFAVLDFESGRGHAQLIALRRKLTDKLGYAPTVFLLLGNTFGNIDQDTFVSQIADVMLPQDILLCEFLLATEQETQPSGAQSNGVHTAQDASFDASKDPRAQFMLNPLRSLGFNPKFQNLQRWTARNSGRWRRDEYRYKFDATERQLALQLTRFEPPRDRLVLAETSWIGLLKIQAVTPNCSETLFKQAFSSIQLVQHSYQLASASGREVKMAYCFAAHSGSPSPAVEVRATRTQRRTATPAPTRLVIKRAKREVAADGESLSIGTSYYALLLLWSEQFHADAAEVEGYKVQMALKSKLEEFQGDTNKAAWFDEKIKGLIRRLGGTDKNAISQVKSDFKRSLREERHAEKAAKFILGILPDDGKWNLKLKPGEISIE